MKRHIKQAEHNKDFHDCMKSTFSERFFDWKITAIFYIALHCLKALSIKLGVDIGHTHTEISKSIDPDNPGRSMSVSRGAFRNYRNLYQYSKTARYEGILDLDTYEELKKTDYEFCVSHLKVVQEYIKSRGVEIEECFIDS